MKSVYKILMILAVIFSVTACSEEFLDQTPQQEVDSGLAISTLADANIALNGCYDQLQDRNVIGRDYIVICDIATDNTKLRPENSGRFLEPYYWQINSEEGYTEAFWVDAYEAINRINNILVKIDGLEGSEAERARIKGEASGLRALVNLMLVNWFAQAYNEDPSGLGIPVILEPLGVEAEEARNTISEVYTQILADLDVADNNLSYSASNYGFFTKGAAKALKSRVYLYMNDWANAKAEAVDVIESLVYSLADYEVVTSDIEDVGEVIEAWAVESTSESIFSVVYSTDDYNYTNSIGSMYHHIGYGDVIPTTDLMDLYSSTDVRNNWFYVEGDYTYIKKYPGIIGTRAGLDNVSVTRLSEVYLNAAEACYELGEEGLAITYLDEIIGRSDAAAPASTETGAPLREKILLERRKELAFEGHRFWDLKRRGLDIERVDKTVENVTDLIVAGSNDYAYPIPQVELNVNSNIQQNPGY